MPDLERLIIYSPITDSFKVVPLPAQQSYFSPPRFLDEKGNLYLAYNDKIYMLSTNNVLTELPIHDHKVAPELKITSMILDKSGVLWAGSNGYGLMKYDLRMKRMPKYEYKTRFHEEVLARLKVPDERIKKTFFYKMKPYNFRWAEAGDGKIWMCKANSPPVQSHNLCYYQNNELIIPEWKYLGNTDEKYGIDALAISNKGELWGIDHNLRPIYFDTARFTATTFDALFDSKKEFSRTVTISALSISDQGVFWLGSNIGLIKYEHGKKSRPYLLSLQGHVIISMMQSKTDKDILWIGTHSDGLVKYSKSTGKTRYYTMKNGLHNNTIYSIIDDGHANFWCSTNKGIFSFNPKTGDIRTYTGKDGLPEDEFNSFSYFKFPDGHIAFGGTIGYTCFKPSSLSIDSFEPKTVITGIKINNEDANYSDIKHYLKQDVNSLGIIRLPYDKNFISLEFAALEFNIPEKIMYRYKLEGMDKKWVMAGYSNIATYTSAPPGNYVFIVNATNTDGKWSRKVKRLSIIVEPPFWLTWWFVSICIIVAAIVIGILIFRKLRSMRHQDRQKMEFERETMELEARALRSQMNPHFIFNCLNSINSLILEDQKTEAVMYLGVFSRLIRNQLNNNLKEISLEDELETCRLYLQLESLRFTDKLEYTFVLPDTIDLGSILVPPLIIQPFIENSIIHGILPLEKTGRIIVSVEQKDKQILCYIDDNGIGREKAEQYREQRRRKHVSHGTNLIKNRISLHNRLSDYSVSVHIEDKKDSSNIATGTCVTLTFTIDD